VTSTSLIPEDYRDLVQRPLFAALGTVRPDGSPQVNAMWFDLDGDYVTFTHTTYRAKYRNLQQNPGMSLMIMDPDDPMRYLELRGRLARIEPDPTGAHYVHLGRRYGNAEQQPPPDSKDRVILYMSVDKVLTH
jgi:PPOX class probable F420-dependent enzyme